MSALFPVRNRNREARRRRGCLALYRAPRDHAGSGSAPRTLRLPAKPEEQRMADMGLQRLEERRNVLGDAFDAWFEWLTGPGGW